MTPRISSMDFSILRWPSAMAASDTLEAWVWLHGGVRSA